MRFACVENAAHTHVGSKFCVLCDLEEDTDLRSETRSDKFVRFWPCSQRVCGPHPGREHAPVEKVIRDGKIPEQFCSEFEGEFFMFGWVQN